MLNVTKIQDLLNKRETEEEEVSKTGCRSWHPEYGAWMVEGTPDAPYSGWMADLWCVKANMWVLRARLLMALGKHEISPTVRILSGSAMSTPCQHHDWKRNVNTMVPLWNDEKTDVTPNRQHSCPGRCAQARRAGCKDSSQ